MYKYYFTTVITACILCSCVTKGRQDNVPGRDTAADPATPVQAGASGDTAYYTPDGDSVIIAPFTINVALSTKAVAKITTAKETIIVSAIFSGTPKDSSSADIAEDGVFDVAFAEKEIHYGEPAVFNKIKMSKKLFNQLADKDIELVINVYTGRKSTKDNLITCDLLAERISKVANKAFTLKGKLIYGDD